MASCLAGFCGSCVLPTIPIPLQTLKVLASTEDRKATDVGDKACGGMYVPTGPNPSLMTQFLNFCLTALAIYIHTRYSLLLTAQRYSSQISGWGKYLSSRTLSNCRFCLHANACVIFLFVFRDQFCSLFFTLSNLYLFACVYARGFDDQWRRCGTSSPHWPAAFALGILPFVVRVVQSLRRYADSKLPTHLVNVSPPSLALGFNLLLSELL